MSDPNKPIDALLYDLKERAKELNCLYEVQELLSTPDISLERICKGIIRAIPPGWQYPDICQAIITYGGSSYQSPGFVETPWVQRADIVVQDEILGRIQVYYTEERPDSVEGPFLGEERKLIDTIAEQFGLHILHQQLKEVFEEQQRTEKERVAEWWVILNMLKRTDPDLLMLISRKMTNYLYRIGVGGAEELLELVSPTYRVERELLEDNRPYPVQAISESQSLSGQVFELASLHVPESEILESIQAWIKRGAIWFPG